MLWLQLGEEEWKIRLQGEVVTQSLEYQMGEAEWGNGTHTWLCIRTL